MSTLQPAPMICDLVAAAPSTPKQYATPGAVNGGSWRWPCSSSAATRCARRPTRSVHCLTNGRGEYLIDLWESIPQWSPNPVDAMATGHSWLSSTVAGGRLRLLRERLPGVPLGLALVELEWLPDGGWRAVGVRVWTVTTFVEEAAL